MFWTACKIFLAMTLLVGCVYPLLITGIAKLIMPYQANGSLIFDNGQVRGSQLIAQPFTEEKYFWPRPSAFNYNTLRSFGSNLGPTSRKLKEQVEQRAQKLAQSDPHSTPIPSDLLYASGSGLDPHISLPAAYFQIDRIARARSLTPQDQEKLRDLIHELAEGTSGVLGPRYINVLLLNMQLDKQLHE